MTWLQHQLDIFSIEVGHIFCDETFVFSNLINSASPFIRPKFGKLHEATCVVSICYYFNTNIM